MKRIALVLAILPLMSCAADWDVTVHLPCYQAWPGCSGWDSTYAWPFYDSLYVETGLDSLDLKIVRFRDNDTLSLGPLSIRGLECDSLRMILDIEPGTVGEAILTTVDEAGNRSCFDYHRTFAFPAIDSSSVASLSPWYSVRREK